MSKAVLISIRPEWCEKIVSGEKTIEVRKTRPKMTTPFKCYIYCTKGQERLVAILKDGDENYGEIYHGKPVFIKTSVSSVSYMYGKRKMVIGEFICNNIYEIDPAHAIEAVISEESCVRPREIHEYLRGKTGYGWSISDLKIYDQPEGLSTFSTFRKCNSYKRCGHDSNACLWAGNCIVPSTIERPPQSWLYVEER